MFNLKDFSFFSDIIKKHFIDNYDINLKRLKELKEKYNNKKFDCRLFSKTSVKLDYDMVISKFQKNKDIIILQSKLQTDIKNIVTI